MSMTCSQCGGVVEWKGPLSNLTHTECRQCGAINSQLPDEPLPEDIGDETRVLVAAEARAFVDRTFEQIRSMLSVHTDAVAQFAVHMQQQLDAANDLLQRLERCDGMRFDKDGTQWTVMVPAELVKAIQNHNAMTKAANAKN